MATVIGIFNDRDSAEEAISDLRSIGIDETDISYVYSAESSVAEGDRGGTNAAGGAMTGAGTGAVLGALAGLAVANGILPGLGTLFVAGPLATALGLTGVAATTAAGAMTGAAAGGLLGALAGLGVKEEDAKLYEERVKLGGILVAAQTAEAAEALDIFNRHGAEEVRQYSV